MRMLAPCVDRQPRAWVEALEQRTLLSVGISADTFQTIMSGGETRLWDAVHASPNPQPNPTHEAEMSVAISPVQVVSGLQTAAALVQVNYPTGPQLRLYVTVNGGDSWTRTEVNSDFDGLSGSGRVDGSLSFDGAGNLYLCYLSETSVAVTRVRAGNIGTDGTLTVGLPNQKNYDVFAFQDYSDGPWLTVGTDGSDPTRPAIYVVAGGVLRGSHSLPNEALTFNKSALASGQGPLIHGAVTADGSLYLLAGTEVLGVSGGLWSAAAPSVVPVVGAIPKRFETATSVPERGLGIDVNLIWIGPLSQGRSIRRRCDRQRQRTIICATAATGHGSRARSAKWR